MARPLDVAYSRGAIRRAIVSKDNGELGSRQLSTTRPTLSAARHQRVRWPTRQTIRNACTA